MDAIRDFSIILQQEKLTNKVRSWERSEPRSEPFVGQARLIDKDGY